MCAAVPVPIPIDIECTLVFDTEIYRMGDVLGRGGDCEDLDMAECGSSHPIQCDRLISVDCNAEITAEVLEEIIAMVPGCDVPGQIQGNEFGCAEVQKRAWAGKTSCSGSISCGVQEGC